MMCGWEEIPSSIPESPLGLSLIHIYMPKATVQAAIGGVPLAMGLACGDIVLTVAVLAILITAPLGAFLIDLTYKRFLHERL